jgi:hypothetical protein
MGGFAEMRRLGQAGELQDDGVFDEVFGAVDLVTVLGESISACCVAGEGETFVEEGEVLTALNKPEDYILALVIFDGESHQVHYIRMPFQREPDFAVTSSNYSVAELLLRAEAPA